MLWQMATMTPALVVIDAAPVRVVPVKLVGHAGAQILSAGHLVAVVEIVDGVEDRVGIIDLDDRPVGKDPPHAGFEDRPLARPVEIVAPSESRRAAGARGCALACASFHSQCPTSTA